MYKTLSLLLVPPHFGKNLLVDLDSFIFLDFLESSTKVGKGWHTDKLKNIYLRCFN